MRYFILLFYMISFSIFGNPHCQTQCLIPFGEKMGEANNVPSYSNCSPKCFSAESHQLDSKQSVGIKWQCVEYARRWLLQNRSIILPSVQTAAEIWDVDELKNSNNDKLFTFTRFPNYSTTSPQIGDFIIYSKSSKIDSLRYGHVAVVVSVDKKSIKIAEQNFIHKKWEDPKAYSRKLVLKKRNGKYYLKDKNFSESDKLIKGWLRVTEVPANN